MKDREARKIKNKRLHEKTEMGDERQDLSSKLCLSSPTSDKKKETKR